MASLNKFMGIGNLGRDAELRYTAAGLPMIKFSIALSESRKKGDEWQTETTWLNVTQFGDAAERASQYLNKGASVYVEGKITVRSWDKDDGTKGYATEILADKVLSLAKRESASDSEWGNSKTAGGQHEDDLPFE